ncbi:MAG: DbpA RNA binding domain-containing protein [Spirochaetota bacterium]|nr:DbpA RNA binding domain-containing protein [Spirochaetota bacterium]
MLASAGFRELTPLQEAYIPAVLQGKDLIVESIPGEGRTIAQLLPFLITPKTRKRGISVLILVDSVELAGKYGVEFNRLSGPKSKGKCAVILGREAQAKSELRLLSKHPGLIVGTTERIIDHLRRNNLEFSREISVIINIPQNSDHLEFDRDVEFIMTKMPEKVQSIVFSPSFDQVDNLSYLLKRPTVLSLADRRARIPMLHVYESTTWNPAAILRMIYGLDLHNTLLLVPSAAEAAGLKEEFNGDGLPTRTVSPNGQNQEETRPENGIEAFFRCSIASFDDAAGIPLAYDSILFSGVPSRLSLFEEIGWAVSSRSPAPYFAVLTVSGESEQLSILQEKKQMKMKNEVPPSREEILKGKLKNLIKQIKEEADPDELNRYRKIIRRNVPLHMRSYLAAYLLKSANGGSLSRSDEPSQMQTIFVSIGKNRKVFPRDLARLFNKALDIDPKEIGNIKVLDNYSFIDIPQDVAPRAIEKLDGIEFRGRNITVNFARKKKGNSN